MTTPFTQPAAAPEGAPVDPGLADAYRQLSAQITQLEDARAVIRSRIEAQLGDHETGLVNGRPAFRWAWSKPSTRLDSKRLQREQPEIWQAYAVTGEPSRRFTPVDPK